MCSLKFLKREFTGFHTYCENWRISLDESWRMPVFHIMFHQIEMTYLIEYDWNVLRNTTWLTTTFFMLGLSISIISSYQLSTFKIKFQIIIWPDISENWRKIGRTPDTIPSSHPIRCPPRLQIPRRFGTELGTSLLCLGGLVHHRRLLLETNEVEPKGEIWLRKL